MPINYIPSLNGTVAYFSATGVLALSDFEKMLDELANDDRLEPGFRQLFDLTSITSSEMTLDSIRKLLQLAKMNPKVTKDTKLAIVVSSDISYKNAKDYEKFAHDDYQDIIVFNSMRTAKIWLDIDDDIIPQD